MPSHGRSGNQRVNMELFTDCIEAVLHDLQFVDLFIGHSMGAICGLMAINRNQDKVGKVVLLASPTRLKDRLTFVYNELSIPPPTEQFLHKKFQQRYGKDYLRENDVSLLVDKWTLPGLIVHDEDDPIVSFKWAETIHQSWKSSELMNTKGLGHNKVIWNPNVVERVVQFVGQKK